MKRDRRYDLPTGSIIRKRPGNCTSNDDAKSNISITEQQRLQAVEKNRIKQKM